MSGRIFGIVASLAIALATSGCVAAGLAGGPLMTAVQAISDRAVERTVGGELSEALGVTEAVLTKMAFRIEEREHGDGIRRLRAVADDVTVHVRLERLTGALTRVKVRVETGGLLPDRDTGSHIQQQIAALLASPPTTAAASDERAVEAVSTLQREVQKLRVDIEQRHNGQTGMTRTEASSSPRVETGAVINVPMSAALPTVGGPAPPVSVASPATPVAAAGQVSAAPREAVDAAVRDARMPGLRPVAPLTPIRPISGDETGR
jgi:Protein of unknown function (DUF3568)